MDWTVAQIGPQRTYRYLASMVVPRPIALVTTMSASGVVNAAPFSFFNLMGHDPALLTLGIARAAGRADGTKDTARNIAERGRFVVNLVNEEIAEPMNACAASLPPEVSEVDRAGFTLMPSVTIDVPRIAEAPAALECRLETVVAVRDTTIYVGEVLHIHLDDRFYDPDRDHVLTGPMHMIGRLSGNAYARTRDTFDLNRPR
jgi:flavin reductase (DIM6/NTAB) family NADH-FMN oxidoreductase RutF